MDENDIKLFEQLVFKELNALNYNFMYPDLTMDKLVMDFAVQYCKDNYDKTYGYYEEKET